MSARRAVDLLIVGCGPCGIGAALELEENARRRPVDYLIVDPSPVPGGWASSRTTPEGFTFDFGGHVLFPHKYYPRFVELLDSLPIEWVASVPKRGVSIDGRFLPYPAQRNLQRLAPGKLLAALSSLLMRRMRLLRPLRRDEVVGDDLESYLLKQFGEYLNETLMGPLNSKMWAHATSALSNQWVMLRSGSKQRNVADVSLRQTMRNLLTQQDTPGWTSDTFVTYPARGGSGEIWRAIAARIPGQRMLLGPGNGVKSVRLGSGRASAGGGLGWMKESHRAGGESTVVTLSSGEEIECGQVISSMPLDTLLRSIEGRDDLHAQADRFVCARSRLYGFGIRGEIGARYDGLHSFHVPDADVPFWRVNLLSNVSPGNVPAEGGPFFSVLVEISEPASRPGEEFGLQEARVEAGLRKLGLLGERHEIVSRFHQTIEHGYPVPFLGRDLLLSEVQRVLEPVGIYSRGRFGAWKYEISNQDHAFMQGVEVVQRLLFGVPETTYTDPHQVNEMVEEASVVVVEDEPRTVGARSMAGVSVS